MAGRKSIPELKLARNKAYKMFREGYSLYFISDTLGIARMTVMNWKNRYRWKAVSRNAAAMEQAKELILKGSTQKEAAVVVGVSEKTMSNWTKRYRWKIKDAIAYHSQKDVNLIMTAFLDYLATMLPELQDPVANSLPGFLLAYQPYLKRMESL